MSFREALQLRLDIIRPSQQNLDDFNKSDKCCKLTAGIKELIDTLHKRKVHVYLVSGGFKVTINPVADQLNISRSKVFANEILHHENGKMPLQIILFKFDLIKYQQFPKVDMQDSVEISPHQSQVVSLV